MRNLTIILLSLLLSGCVAMKAQSNKVEPNELPEVVTKSRFNELVNLAPPDGPPITVAMYGFGDKTGQRKENDKFSVLSSAVTQGGEVFLIKAMQDASKGRWFQVVERVGLDNLIKERQLIRNQRETYEGKDAKPLAPMLIAGVMVEGGIVGYDTNLSSGGAGAALLGIGANAQYRTDVVTVIIRLVSVHTGEVLITAGATKTILSTGISGNIMKFVDHGTMSVQTEMGSNTNESSTYAVRLATEAAVVDLIKQGATKGLWKFASTKAKTESQTALAP